MKQSCQCQVRLAQIRSALCLFLVAIAGCDNGGNTELYDAVADAATQETVHRVIGVSLPAGTTNVYCHSSASMNYFAYLRFDIPSEQKGDLFARNSDLLAASQFAPDQTMADNMIEANRFENLPWWKLDGIEKPVFAEHRDVRKATTTSSWACTRTMYLGQVSPGVTRVLLLLVEEPAGKPK